MNNKEAHEKYNVDNITRPTLLLAPLFAAVSMAATAQDTPTATAGPGMLEEVIVSATRRDQTLMEAPIAISAFTERELFQRNIREVSELQMAAPSLLIRTSSSEVVGTEVRIRGVGTSGNNPGLEASVGVFIDGIYRSRSGLATGDLMDIGGVEVIRGPQGTLFGRNTSAGALVLHSNKPEYEWGGYVKGGVENYDGYSIEGAVTGPLVGDTLAMRLAANYRQRDGWIEDRLVDREFYDRDRYSIKGQLLWNPSDDLELRFIADYREKNDQCCTGDYDVAGPTAPVIQSLGGVVEEDPYAYKTQTTFGSKDELEDSGLSAEVNWRIDDNLKLTYIGAWRDSDAVTDLDPDTSNVDITQGVNWLQDTEFTSHELRLNGTSGKLDWLVGAYYYTEDINVNWSLTYGSQFGEYFSILSGNLIPSFLFPEGAGDTDRAFAQEADGWAVFTHNIIELTDDWDMVAGLRWSKDNKEAKSVITNNAIHCGLAPFIPYCPIDGIDDDRSEEEPTGTLKFVRNYDSGTFYVSYARGYKAGGYNLDRDAVNYETEFAPETVDAYELGVKWTDDSRTWQANSALFYSKFKDFQINEFDGIAFEVTNAGEVVSQGIEVEGSWLPRAGLTVDLGVTYAETEYEKHPGTNNIGEPLEGQQIPHAPKWTVIGAVAYEHDIGELTGFVSANAAYRDEHNTSADLHPETMQDAYTLVNARIGLKSASESWNTYLWANNLFEEEYSMGIYPAPLQTGSWSSFRGEPRTYGIAAEFVF